MLGVQLQWKYQANILHLTVRTLGNFREFEGQLLANGFFVSIHSCVPEVQPKHGRRALVVRYNKDGKDFTIFIALSVFTKLFVA